MVNKYLITFFRRDGVDNDTVDTAGENVEITKAYCAVKSFSVSVDDAGQYETTNEMIEVKPTIKTRLLDSVKIDNLLGFGDKLYKITKIDNKHFDEFIISFVAVRFNA